jgi:hypothetical protein
MNIKYLNTKSIYGETIRNIFCTRSKSFRILALIISISFSLNFDLNSRPLIRGGSFILFYLINLFFYIHRF